MEYPIWFVCALGVGVVFIGLVCIVLLCKLISIACKIAENTGSKVQVESAQKTQAPTQTAAPVEVKEIPNRKKLIAAISAVIAEENGTDVSAIRIKSFRKI